MRQAEAHCIKIECVGTRTRAYFDCPVALAPGQALLARLSATHDPYLRQTLLPSAIFRHGFAVDVDPSPSTPTPGAVIDVLGAIGNPLVEARLSSILLIADIDPAPLLPLTATANAATLLLQSPYPLSALDPQIEVRIGNDLVALALEYAHTAETLFVCAAPALARQLATALTPANGFALLAPAMPCGTGACGACGVRTKHGFQPACTDGLFFKLNSLTG